MGVLKERKKEREHRERRNGGVQVLQEQSRNVDE
jgi:hypothetical protein